MIVVIINFFKYAPWLTPERVLRWEKAFAALWLALIAFDLWYRTRAGITDTRGYFLGEDFINLWSGAKLAVQGKVADVYDIAAFNHYHLQVAHMQRLHRFNVKNYAYPPVTLLLTLPLAALPYVPALLAWWAAGTGACAFALSRMTGWRKAWLATLAGPAAYECLHWGGNGFFTAALMGGGLLLLPRRPAAAGALFGLLCYKPHIGILIPVALAAGRHWKAFFAAGVTVAALVGLSALVFGAGSWLDFREMASLMRWYLENAPHSEQPTVFTSFHLLMRHDHAVPYAAQAVSALCAAVLTWRIWRGNAAPGVKGAALMLCTLLSTPYAWNQDMIMLVFAGFWIAEDAARAGFMPWEKLLWLIAFIMPITLMPAARATHIESAPFVMWLLMLFVWRRARQDENRQDEKTCLHVR